jgi:type IV secretory pathway VirD2 relaxase
MSLIESELGKVLYPAVKPKKNRTQNLRAIAKRVVRGAPEVMVKITGFCKGAGHVKAHIKYITRNGKLEMENEREEVFFGKEENNLLFSDWKENLGESKRRKNQRDTMSLVLSKPESTDPEAVKKAAREFAKATFGKNYEYVFVLHTDRPQPHCHISVKCLGFNGKRLNPRKADLQIWRKRFAEKLRDQGEEAEATPRRSRGVVKKAVRGIIMRIERGDKSHKPRVSKVTALKIKETAIEIITEAKGLPVDLKPWEEAIMTRQSEIRRAWLTAADALENEDSRLTFNQKEIQNERPDYDRITTGRARAGQRAAALYQSNLEGFRCETSPGTNTCLRNVSSVSVVHDERASEVLLRANASDNLGRERASNPEMRWPRISDPWALRNKEQIRGTLGVAEKNKAFAARIRGFVGAMPSIDTERHQLKQDLIQKFKIETVLHPSIGQKNEQRDKDVER